MFCVFMICPVLQPTAVRFSVCAEYFVLIKQSKSLAIQDRYGDAVYHIYSNGFYTFILALLADYRIRKPKRAISQPESHRSLATRLFLFDTRSPCAKFFACLAYLRDRR